MAWNIELHKLTKINHINIVFRK